MQYSFQYKGGTKDLVTETSACYPNPVVKVLTSEKTVETYEWNEKDWVYIISKVEGYNNA